MKIRPQGYTLKPVEYDLYVEPIDELTDVQRLWLIANEPEKQRQLFTERWQRFLSQAKAHGIHPHVVAAEFPTHADKLDVIEPPEHDDNYLRAMMSTVCSDVREKQRQTDYESGRWVPVENGR